MEARWTVLLLILIGILILCVFLIFRKAIKRMFNPSNQRSKGGHSDTHSDEKYKKGTYVHTFTYDELRKINKNNNGE